MLTEKGIHKPIYLCESKFLSGPGVPEYPTYAISGRIV